MCVLPQPSLLLPTSTGPATTSKGAAHRRCCCLHPHCCYVCPAPWNTCSFFCRALCRRLLYSISCTHSYIVTATRAVSCCCIATSPHCTCMLLWLCPSCWCDCLRCDCRHCCCCCCACVCAAAVLPVPVPVPLMICLCLCLCCCCACAPSCCASACASADPTNCCCNQVQSGAVIKRLELLEAKEPPEEPDQLAQTIELASPEDDVAVLYYYPA